MSVDPITEGGRLQIAFGQPTLAWTTTWTTVDAYPNLVTSYTIDRGRQYELDRTDSGRAVVEIADQDGILDPTNPAGPFFGQLEPLLQARIRRRNPITGAWSTRFRGFVEDWDYDFDRSQKVNRLTMSLVDIFEILAAIEMELYPKFGIPPNKENAGQIVYPVIEDEIDPVRLHMTHLVSDGGYHDDDLNWFVFFSGNVQMWDVVYSPGENVLSALQEASDAEFPGVGNCYTDRTGRFVFHGRFAKFNPAAIATDAGPDRWTYHEWNAGDGAAVRADETGETAQIREFAFNRGLSKIINQASAAPMWVGSSASSHPPTEAELQNQLVEDTGSSDQYGIRGWSAESLLTKKSMLVGDGSGALAETRKFAHYYVDNYKTPHNRITVCGFRSIQADPDYPGAAQTWELLNTVDISDSVNVTVASPGGGGFDNEGFFVEGVHEDVKALSPMLDDVTLRLDLSPRALYPSDYPWEGGPPDETGGGGGGGGDSGQDVGGWAPGDPAEMGSYASAIAAGAPGLTDPAAGNPIKMGFDPYTPYGAGWPSVPSALGLQYFGGMKDESRVFGVGNWQDGSCSSDCKTKAPHIHVKFRDPPGGGNTTWVYI